MGELTRITNKCILPVGPWPMVYYPLHKMVEAGVDEIMIVSGSDQPGAFIKLLGSGRNHKCNLTYRVQDEPLGIANALLLAEGFCRDDKCVVALGDNIFEDSLGPILEQAVLHPDWAWVMFKEVPDPTRFGVPRLDQKKIVEIVEKPKDPPSTLAVTGIYVYPPDVFDVIRSLEPSPRGEYEITDVNNHYVSSGRIGWSLLDGYWTDAGTIESWQLANKLVAERNQKA